MTNTLVNRYADYILVELVLSRAHKNKSRANAWNEFRKPNLVEFSKFRKTTVQGMLEREEMMITNWRFFFSLSTRDRLFWQQINKENFQHTDVHVTTTKNTTLQMETRKPIKSSDWKPDNSCVRIYTIVFVFLFIFFFVRFAHIFWFEYLSRFEVMHSFYLFHWKSDFISIVLIQNNWTVC